MTLNRLLFRNLLFHWRGNLAVLLGVVVGSAVLTGALLVGDSLRGSLRDLTLKQLAWVESALVGGRFVRDELATELQAEHVSPALLLQGAANTEGKSAGSKRRVGRVAILGVDERFWPRGSAPLDREFWRPADPADLSKSGVVLNATLAQELGVQVGDRIVLHFQKASAVPRESVLGRRKGSEVLDQLSLTVQGIIPDDSLGARFSLNPSPEAPRNAFVPLSVLQSRLDLQGRVNALLASGPAEPLQRQLRERLKLDDWGLELTSPEGRAAKLFRYLDPRNRDGKLPRARWQGRVPEELANEAGPDSTLTREQVIAFYRDQHPYLSLESRQMLLEDLVASAALKAARETGLTPAPTLVYLADTISDGSQEIPYSVVAALDPTLPPPLGPFLPPGVNQLDDEGIILADWPESPLQAKPGDRITLTYYQVEEQGRLERKKATFILRGKVPLHGAADDPFLTPEFRGITDQLDIRSWEDPPFPYQSERVKPADERYWNRYRTTPKAYVTLRKGQELWGTRFGKFTSIRLAPANDGDLGRAEKEFRLKLLSYLDPEQGGLVFDAVRERGLLSATGGTDFSELFLYFSFFLIVAALLLVGLLCRLNLDRRAAEVGVLFAAGFRRSTVRWLLLAEGTLLAVVGALIGCIVAVFYSDLLLRLLSILWPGGLDRSFLRLHVTAQSFAIGYLAALVVSLLTIAWAVRVMGKASPRALLAGETGEETDPNRQIGPPRWSLWLTVGAVIGALALISLGGFVHDHEMRAGTFFGSGALLLTAALAGAWAWMRRGRHALITGHGLPALTRLGVRNASRHPVRSLLTAGLLASSAFLLVAVESFRRHAGDDYRNPNSGSGGFALLAESDVPVYQDLNSDAGRQELNDDLERQLRADLKPPELAAAQAVLHGVTFFPFRVRSGDDASCLNLYQPRRPRLLGVPSAVIERGGFQFADCEASTPEERANPWLLLQQPRRDGAVPVIGEQNTLTWMLRKKLGDVIEIPSEKGSNPEPLRLRVVGLLKDSVFQNGLLMSEDHFLELYPGHQGYNLFLIDTKKETPEEVKNLLQIALAERGIEAVSTAERLESYLAVENTYLSTFQVLGGLGLLLGALGLAVVLLRGVWERRGELALLRALGYRHGALGWLVLAENAFLLLLGLGAGTLAALVAVAPHLAGGQGEVAWPALLGMLGLVLVVGLAAGAAAVAATLRAPLVPALRRE